MPATLPYLNSYKNVDKLFERIASAKTPDAFNHPFLQQTIGLKGTGDRQMIPLLRSLEFIDAAGKPTAAYGGLKNTGKTRKATMAAAIARAYKPLFDSNEKAHTLGQEELKSLVGQVAGSDAGMTTKIVGTLNALLKLADFDAVADDIVPDESGKEKEKEKAKPPAAKGDSAGALRSEFHFNIQVHLPANATEETYVSIFTALRKSFG